MQPTESEIRERSYQIWENEGQPEGRAWDHWLRAEAELREKEAQEGSSQPQQSGTTGTEAEGAKGPNGSS
jgi:hypothetical protein